MKIKRVDFRCFLQIDAFYKELIRTLKNLFKRTLNFIQTLYYNTVSELG